MELQDVGVRRNLVEIIGQLRSVVDHLVLLRHEVGVERVAAVGLTEHHFLRVNKDRAGERVLIFLARRQLRRLTGQRL